MRVCACVWSAARKHQMRHTGVQRANLVEQQTNATNSNNESNAMQCKDNKDKTGDIVVVVPSLREVVSRLPAQCWSHPIYRCDESSIRFLYAVPGTVLKYCIIVQ